MTIATTCHCGAVQVTVPYRPRTVTNCNCAVCRRYGVLWGYYAANQVRIDAPEGTLVRYQRQDKPESWAYFVHCARCGCVTHWERVMPNDRMRMGVNMRNFAPEQLGAVNIRLLDGADTEKYLRRG